jgi:hypothetical protein
VLCLGQKVYSDDERVSMLVSHDQNFRGAGEQVNTHFTEELTLGLGDERVAWSGQHVDRLDGLGADGEGRYGLDAAEKVNLIGAGQIHGGHRGIGNLALDQRRAGSNAFNAGNLGGDDGHMRAGQQRVLPARNVGAGRLDRNVLLAEENTRQGFDFEVTE